MADHRIPTGSASQDNIKFLVHVAPAVYIEPASYEHLIAPCPCQNFELYRSLNCDKLEGAKWCLILVLICSLIVHEEELFFFLIIGFFLG